MFEKRSSVSRLALVSGMAAMICTFSPAYADDEVDEPSKFEDRALLVETLGADEEQARTDLQADLDAGDITQAEFDEAVAAIDQEDTDTAALVEELSDDQVVALNRSLNNAVSSKLIVNIDAEHLQTILDGEYDKRQIMALTTGLEGEARFTSKAAWFEDKAEETGNDKFLEKAERFREKAATQKDKFLSKAERFGGTGDNAGGMAAQSAKDAAKLASKDAAKGNAKSAAKTSAKNAAKLAAKDSAKSAAKDASKSAAKNAAKDAAKEQAKDAARNAAKGKNS